MRYLLTIALLLSLFFVIACGEEEGTEVVGDDSIETVEEAEEIAAPAGEEFSDVVMVGEIVDRFYTAVAEGDRKTAMELSFPPFDIIMEEKQFNEEEQLLAEEWRSADLELFERDWAKLTEAGTELLDWNHEVTGVTSPAGGEFYLVVYGVDVELLMSKNGDAPVTMEKSGEVHYLNSKLLYVRLPF